MSEYGDIQIIMSSTKDNIVDMTAEFLLVNRGKLEMQALIVEDERKKAGIKLIEMGKVSFFSKKKLRQMLLHREISVLDKEARNINSWQAEFTATEEALRLGYYDIVLTFLDKVLNHSAPRIPALPGGQGTPPPTMADIYFSWTLLPGLEKMHEGLSAIM